MKILIRISTPDPWIILMLVLINTKKTIQVSKLLMKKYHLNQDISESDIQKNCNLNSKKAETFGNLQKYAKSLQIFVMQYLEIFGILNY